MYYRVVTYTKKRKFKTTTIHKINIYSNYETTYFEFTDCLKYKLKCASTAKSTILHEFFLKTLAILIYSATMSNLETFQLYTFLLYIFSI